MSKTEALRKMLDSRKALDKQIEKTQREVKVEGVAKVKSAMAEHGLLPADLAAVAPAKAAPARVTAKAPAAKPGPKAAPVKVAAQATKPAGKKVAPKYRNAATGETWSGRGLKPRWLTAALSSGRALAEFTL